MRKVVWAAICLLMISLTGTALAVPPGPGRPGNEPQLDLLWVASGIMAMDRDPNLRITPAQAGKILEQLQSLADKGAISLSVTPDKSGPSGMRPPQGGPGPADPDRMREAQERMAKPIKGALKKIDKVLAESQVSYIDNMDFDATPYTVAPPPRPNGDRVGPPSGPLSNPPSDLMAEMRKSFEVVQERTARVFRQTMEYLRQRANSPK